MARPKKIIKFPAQAVKQANERLRKLEVVNRLAQHSEAYKSVERFANDPNSYSNKFYREYKNKDGSPGIRFMSAESYKKLSRYDQMKFDEIVNNFLNNATSYKTGIEVVRKRNYDKFMENHPDLSWSQEEYDEFWLNYSQAQKDKEEIIAYGVLTQIFNTATQYSDNMTDKKITELLHYNVNTGHSKAPTKTILKSRKYRR